MSPKEKAEQLVTQFENLKPTKMSDYSRIYTPTAKQCALIVCDEIMTQNISTPHDYGASRTYWMQVKQEIYNI